MGGRGLRLLFLLLLETFYYRGGEVSKLRLPRRATELVPLLFFYVNRV